MQIIGHKAQIRFLDNLIKKGQANRAFLFFGHKNIGKAAVAKHFAKKILCERKKGRGCECDSCVSFSKNIHPDFFCLSKEKEIYIEDIKNVEKFLSSRPYLSKGKAVIIENANLMNIYAQNSFLKTLEEHSENSAVIMTADSLRFFLPTVLSRMIKVRFHFVDNNEIASSMDFSGLKEPEKEFLLRVYAGMPGKIKELLENKEKIGFLMEKEKDILALKNKNYFYRFNYIATLLDNLKKQDSSSSKKNDLDKVALFEILEIWIRILRYRLIIGLGKKKLENYDNDIPPLKVLDEVYKFLKSSNINIKTALNYLMINI